MNASKKEDGWAEGMTFITYMKFADLEPWKETFNTIADENDRGESYEDFKARKTDRFLEEIELKFPGIKDCIKSVHTSTPLSYRDYIGGHNGNMYGYEKDSNNPMKTFIASKTKLDNLYLTGQSINMHGVLGVTIGAVVTCSEILGKNIWSIKLINIRIENKLRCMKKQIGHIVFFRFAFVVVSCGTSKSMHHQPEIIEL